MKRNNASKDYKNVLSLSHYRFGNFSLIAFKSLLFCSSYICKEINKYAVPVSITPTWRVYYCTQIANNNCQIAIFLKHVWHMSGIFFFLLTWALQHSSVSRFIPRYLAVFAYGTCLFPMYSRQSSNFFKDEINIWLMGICAFLITFLWFFSIAIMAVPFAKVALSFDSVTPFVYKR